MLELRALHGELDCLRKIWQMKLVVLNVANPFIPVNPQVLTGAEQLLSHLDAALTISGHESFVMACEGSVTEVILLATPKPASAAAFLVPLRWQHREPLQRGVTPPSNTKRR